MPEPGSTLDSPFGQHERDHFPLLATARQYAELSPEEREAMHTDELLHEQRRELYVITAVVLDRVTPRILEGMDDFPGPIESKRSFIKAMSVAAFESLHDQWHEIVTDDELAPVFDRMMYLTNNVPHVADGVATSSARVREFMLAGIRTAVDVDSLLLDAFPAVIKRDLGEEALTNMPDIARRSDHLPAQLAALDLRQLNAALRDLRFPEGGTIRPEALRVRMTKRGPIVVFANPVGREDASSFRWLGPHSHERLGCPGRVAFPGSPSSVERTWNRVVDEFEHHDMWLKPRTVGSDWDGS